MEIKIKELITGADQAEGLTVIIDVFRAFTVECYAFAGGAALCYPTSKLEDAFALKEEDPTRILMGERGGAKVDGFDLGNSPYAVTQTDFHGKTMVHTTSSGTQGIIHAYAAGSSEIITGSLVNARAVCEYIKARSPEKVSFVAMGNAGVTSAPEDLLAAKYMESVLKGQGFDLDGEIAHLRNHGAEKFFDPKRVAFPEEDYPLCVDCDRFPFILKVNKKEGRTTITRIDPPFG